MAVEEIGEYEQRRLGRGERTVLIRSPGGLTNPISRPPPSRPPDPEFLTPVSGRDILLFVMGGIGPESRGRRFEAAPKKEIPFMMK
jgi:hypothetical protein